MLKYVYFLQKLQVCMLKKNVYINKIHLSGVDMLMKAVGKDCTSLFSILFMISPTWSNLKLRVVLLIYCYIILVDIYFTYFTQSNFKILL